MSSFVFAKPFIAALTAIITGFTGSYGDTNIMPILQRVNTVEQINIDQASSTAFGGGAAAGITILDRAKGNAMRSNGELAHVGVPLYTMTRLFILMNYFKSHKDMDSEDEENLVSMMQGYSAEATDALWGQGGGRSIIENLSSEYVLQETVANDDWRLVESTALDMGRLVRRFFDDDKVSDANKRLVMSMLKNYSTSVAGTDYNFGIPAAMGNSEASSASVPNVQAFYQGDVNANRSQVRGSVAILGDNYRYVVVILGEAKADMGADNLNQVFTRIAETAIFGQTEGTDNSNAQSILSQNSSSSEDEVRDFKQKQEKIFGKSE